MSSVDGLLQRTRAESSIAANCKSAIDGSMDTKPFRSVILVSGSIVASCFGLLQTGVLILEYSL